jgi:hypothetical protein
MKWLDRFPLLWLGILVLWLAAAPVVPEPHRVEQLRQLGLGALSRPVDPLDRLLHSVPLLLLILRLWRNGQRRRLPLA